MSSATDSAGHATSTTTPGRYSQGAIGVVRCGATLPAGRSGRSSAPPRTLSRLGLIDVEPDDRDSGRFTHHKSSNPIHSLDAISVASIESEDLPGGRSRRHEEEGGTLAADALVSTGSKPAENKLGTCPGAQPDDGLDSDFLFAAERFSVLRSRATIQIDTKNPLESGQKESQGGAVMALMTRQDEV